MSEFWNPWHGCRKISPGCAHCYVYRIDKAHGREEDSTECTRTLSFDLPVRKKRDGSYKVPPRSLIYTCFTSDFFLDEADEWREEAWDMIRERRDCKFLFFTKRIDRFAKCIPADWGNGWSNVIIGCTVENNEMAEYRLPYFILMPIRHRIIGVEPMLERVDLSRYLSKSIESVSAGGESGPFARPCDFDWVTDLRRQCIEAGVPFSFHQTGANFIKDGKSYSIPRKLQHDQAKKAGLDT